MDDARSPQQALSIAEDYLRRGARMVGPRRPRRYAIVTGAAATAVGATFDIPATWHDVGALLRFPLAMAVVAAWTLYSRGSWRARPRPQGYGRYALAVVLGVHLAGALAATALGLALQRVSVPVPFALAGFAYGVLAVVVAFAAARWAGARYLDRIGRGQW